jgi:hypothetical protein
MHPTGSGFELKACAGGGQAETASSACWCCELRALMCSRRYASPFGLLTTHLGNHPVPAMRTASLAVAASLTAALTNYHHTGAATTTAIGGRSRCCGCLHCGRSCLDGSSQLALHLDGYMTCDLLRECGPRASLACSGGCVIVIVIVIVTESQHNHEATYKCLLGVTSADHCQLNPSPGNCMSAAHLEHTAAGRSYITNCTGGIARGFSHDRRMTGSVALLCIAPVAYLQGSQTSALPQLDAGLQQSGLHAGGSHQLDAQPTGSAMRSSNLDAPACSAML